MGEQAQKGGRLANAAKKLGKVGWESIAIACLFTWYGLACHVSVEPEYTLPIWFLSHPRRDLSWLVFLLAAVVVAGLLWAVLLGGNGGRRAEAAWSMLRQRWALPVASSVMTVGTALITFCSMSPVLCSLGAAVAGCGFVGAVAVVASRGRRVVHSPRNVLMTNVLALGIAGVAKLLLLLMARPVIYILVCLLPLVLILVVPPPEKPLPASFMGMATDAIRMDSTRLLHTDHMATLLVCFCGLGLFLGIVGFGTDMLPEGPLLSYHLSTAAAGSLLGCVGLLAFGRKNPDAPFVLLPVLLGTVALLLPFESQSFLSICAMVLAKAVDSWAFVLMAVAVGELFQMHAANPAGALRPLMGSLALVGLLLLGGILVGGVLMSVVGRDITAMALVAVSLVYVTMLALGLSAQRRSHSNYIIVRNPQDVAHIAEAQAQAIGSEFPAISPRELDVLRLLLQHQTIDRMAEELGISRNTVKSHIAHLYEKTGLNSRQQLVDLAATKTVQG